MSSRSRRATAPAPDPHSVATGPRSARFAPWVPVAAALLAHAGPMGGEFVYDDTKVFVERSALAAGDWWSAAFGDWHQPLANRPFTCLTFALQPTFGATVAAYRVGNLILHVVCALLVFGVVRRCLLAPNLAERFRPTSAAWLAAVIAGLWACHPLGTDAVVYITQRTTLLMSTCFVAALYAVLRNAESPRRRWQVLAVGALALGMASKEEMVAAPVLVVLFERAFVLPDWRAARPRMPFYLMLAASWVVLALCVAAGPANETVGYHTFAPVTAVEWLATQAGVILHYLRLVLWPAPLRALYDLGITRDVTGALPQLLAVAAVFVATIWQWRRRPWLAWLGTMFFLLLGPTSSVMPIVTEVVAERRMYLPMLAVLVPVVLGMHALLGRLALPGVRTAVAVTLVVLGGAAYVVQARRHAPVFRDQQRFWSDAVANNELTNGSIASSVILGAWAETLRAQGRDAEALPLLERAMQCRTPMAIVPRKYAQLLLELGRLDDSERVLRDLVGRYPAFGEGLGQLAFLLVRRHELAATQGQATAADPRLAEAIDLAQRAYRSDPQAGYLNTLGMALASQARLAEAEQVLRRALASEPSLADAAVTLGAVLCLAGKPDEGLAQWRQLLPQRPRDLGLRLRIAQASAHFGRTAEAVAMLEEVLRIEPGHDQAAKLLGELRAGGR